MEYAHARVERPGTVVLPAPERLFNPSRETRFILQQANAIGEQASRLCQMLFAIERRGGQRKLWGIVHLARHYPRHLVDAACVWDRSQLGVRHKDKNTKRS